MTVNNADGLNNILRLAGLKNVSGRRRVQGDGVLQDMPVDYDFSGVSSEGAMPVMPESDEMGEKAVAQSYDVRANQVIDPEGQEPMPEETSIWSRIGGALADYVNPEKRAQIQSQFAPQQSVTPQTPPVETAEVDMQEGIPPVTASEQEAEVQASPLERLGSGFKSLFTPKLTDEFVATNPELAQKDPTYPQYMAEKARQREIDQDDMRRARENPWDVAVYGATNRFINTPELHSNFQTYTGLNFDEKQAEMTEKYEKVLSDLEKGFTQNEASYDEQEKRIKDRIMANQATDMDKYYIGMALLMPLLIGGVLGAEAGVGALGGAAKGLGQVYSDRQKQIEGDEELLADINKQRSALTAKKGELELERLKIPEAIKKSLPKDEYEDLKGVKIYNYANPETGEIVATGAEILPDLVVDLRYANTPEKRKDMQKVAQELALDKSNLEKADRAYDNLLEASLQLKDTGYLGQAMAYALTEDKNDALKKIMKQNAPTIIVDGRKVNAFVYFDSQIEALKDAYRRSEGMKQMTSQVVDHLNNMIANYAYEGLTPRDFQEQVLLFKDRSQEYFVDKLRNNGFLVAPIEAKIAERNQKIFDKLNQKEAKTAYEPDKTKIMRNQ